MTSSISTVVSTSADPILPGSTGPACPWPDAPAARADHIDALLPQTQCRQCGYAGCRPYAQAIADGSAPINRCPPGGAAGVAALARLTGQPVLPLDPQCGTEQPLQVAFVIESLCIGCTKCLQACPVDAISGAAGWLHTIVPELCTGCRLCVAPCPVDCIEMHDPAPPRAWTREDALAARARHDARHARLAGERVERERNRADAQAAASLARKRTVIQAAVERARRRAAARAPR